MSQAMDYDGAWKEAIELYLQPFLQLCFPEIAQCIDWSAPVEFLDKELQEIVRDAHLGKQWVDKLIKDRWRTKNRPLTTDHRTMKQSYARLHQN
jgi:hypothetical protein